MIRFWEVTCKKVMPQVRQATYNTESVELLILNMNQVDRIDLELLFIFVFKNIQTY